MDAIEAKLYRQISLCLINGVAYALWQGGQLTYFARAPAGQAVAGIGGVVWFATLITLLWPLRRIWSKRAGCEAPDERIARNSARSMMAAYWCLIVAIGLLFPLALLAPIAPIDIARGLAIIGVATPAFAFGILEARDGRS